MDDAVLNLNDLQFFAAAVEQGGFAAAARHLNVPKSTVSKRVAALEEALSARLIHRTSRSFVLTDLGRDFHERARAALIEAEAAEAVVRERQAEPSGVVRLTCSIPTAQTLLAARLPALARTHPRLQLQVEVTDRFVDLLQENVDIALRCHRAPLPDSGLIQRQLVVEPFILVAAPAYLDVRGRPTSPADLATHAGLPSAPTEREWQLTGPDGAAGSASPPPAMIANESSVLIGAASAGLGIACLPEPMCRNAIAEGVLEQVLPGWQAGAIATTLLTTHRRGQLPGVRAVMAFLAEHVGEA